MKLSHTIPVTPWRASSTWAFRPRMTVPLVGGLALFGVGEGLLVQSHWGATPWTVFALGVARHVQLSIGWATALISCVVLLLWFPLRERPGLGTIANLVIIAFVLDVTTQVVAVPASAVLKSLYIVAGIAVIGLGSALYLTTGLGPGPRDGLMTGLHRRLHASVVYVRLIIEIIVLGIGWLLGGTVGIGTALFAAAIGFSVGISLHLVQWAVRLADR